MTNIVENTPDADDAPRDLASILYGRPPTPPADDAAPDAIKAERAADTARALYSPQTTYAKSITDDMALDLALDAHAVREVCADLGLHPDEAQQLFAMPHAASQDERDANHNETVDAVRRGELSRADLQIAREFAQRDPRVKDFLNDTGLGDSLPVIQKFAELARRARNR